ncbi:CapA family protein [Gemmatimonadota bacterium]
MVQLRLGSIVTFPVWRRVLIVAVAAVFSACSSPRPEPEVRLVLAGQALIKKDPRTLWDDPYGSLRPILERADAAFTNFEMAVLPEGDRCGVPAEYEVSLGTPRLPAGDRPGNSGGPHAVAPEVMEFLAHLGFNLMSLSNNHAWDLGDCGVAATRAAAEASGVAHAGTGPDISRASAPGYLTVGDFTIALVAATTSHDERSAIRHAVNGVWTGRPDDWDRNLAAVRDAAANADFVLYYHHFQLDLDEFSQVSPGDTTGDGHAWVDDVAKWQGDFAHAVLDAGASMYVGHGHRAFDGVEVYDGKPLLRQLGGLAYQGLDPEIGAYDEHRPWEGLITEVIIRGSRIVRLEFTPLDLDEGQTYRSDCDDLEFLSRRGLAQLATGPQASAILRRVRELSANYGVELELSGGKAILDIGSGN